MVSKEKMKADAALITGIETAPEEEADFKISKIVEKYSLDELLILDEMVMQMIKEKNGEK